MGASTYPCLTPFVTLNDSETSPQTLTFAIIPVCSASIIVVNFSGHPYFLSSCHSPVLPTVSNALLKSTNTIYSGRSCSMHFSCSCRRQNIISTVPRLPLKPHSVSGTTSGLMWVDSLLSRILAKILPAVETREFLYSSHSLFDHLSCRWLQCWHPFMLVVQNPPQRHW